jgi:hypothetical protein
VSFYLWWGERSSLRWFGDMDSNHDSQIQSLTSYH